MNKSMVIGAVLGAVIVTAGGAIAMLERNPRSAEVIDVEPVMRTVQVPREVCGDEAVTRQKPVKDEHQVTGSVIGAVVGGVVGSQVGSGRGRRRDRGRCRSGRLCGQQGSGEDPAGQHHHHERARVPHRVYDSKEETVGYDVRYRLGDREDVVRMDHDPGSRIPVKDGELVLAENSAPSKS